MENNTVLIIAIAVLVVGLVGGAFLFPTTVTVTEQGNNTIIREVCETPEPVIVTRNVTVEKITEKDYVSEALAEFLLEVDDDDSLLECDGYEYDFDEVSVSRVYDDWKVRNLADDKYKTSFEVKLKYDEDSERSCRRTFTPKVTFEEDEDPIVVY